VTPSLPHPDRAVNELEPAVDPRKGASTRRGGTTDPMTALDELVDHLVRITDLDRRQAARVVVEVLTFFDESTEAFVRRRHRELQRSGLANPAIFDRIAEELTWWRVAAPALTQRQIRRIVYG
jgi:hypothetical protein